DLNGRLLSKRVSYVTDGYERIVGPVYYRLFDLDVDRADPWANRNISCIVRPRRVNVRNIKRAEAECAKPRVELSVVVAVFTTICNDRIAFIIHHLAIAKPTP